MEDPASDRLDPAPDPLSPLRGKFPGWEAGVGIGGILYHYRIENLIDIRLPVGNNCGQDLLITGETSL